MGPPWGGSVSAWYLVESPEYDSGGWHEPPEPCRDFALVEADSAKQAKWAAFKLWRANPRQCDWPALSSGGHPLSGVKARRWETIGEGIDPTPSDADKKAWEPFVVVAATPEDTPREEGG